jgi:hypothetical protein
MSRRFSVSSRIFTFMLRVPVCMSLDMPRHEFCVRTKLMDIRNGCFKTPFLAEQSFLWKSAVSSDDFPLRVNQAALVLLGSSVPHLSSPANKAWPYESSTRIYPWCWKLLAVRCCTGFDLKERPWWKCKGMSTCVCWDTRNNSTPDNFVSGLSKPCIHNIIRWKRYSEHRFL